MKILPERWQKKPLIIVFDIAVITFIVLTTLRLDRAQRLASGIFWLIGGVAFFLMKRNTQFMEWMYKNQINWIKNNQTFEEFRGDPKDAIFLGAVLFIIILVLAILG